MFSRARSRAIGLKVALAVAAGALASGLTGALVASPAGAAAPVTVNCPTDDLQSAINSAAPGSTINVSGTCTGNFDIETNLTLHGPATLDGNNSGTVLVVGSTVTLSDLTIQHGNSGQGGGIVNFGTLTLRSSQVSNNTASSDTGGIVNAVGNLTLDSSSVSNNTAPDEAGIWNYFGNLTLNSSSVSNNTATSASSGGILNYGTATLNSSLVSGNTAHLLAGGIGNGTNGGFGTLTLKSSTVSNNVANGGPGSGGGIYTSSSLTGTRLLSSSVTANTPDNCGGVPVSGCIG